MNKFAQALLLSLVIAAPVAVSAPAVQAAPTSHTTVAAPKASNKIYRKYHHRRGHHRVSNAKSITK